MTASTLLSLDLSIAEDGKAFPGCLVKGNGLETLLEGFDAGGGRGGVITPPDWEELGASVFKVSGE